MFSKMNRLITLTFQYYRLLLFNNIIFSLMIGTLLIMFAGNYIIVLLILTKLIAYFSAKGHHYYMHADSFYYYRNAGISIRRLYTYSLVIDLAFLAVIIISYKFIAACLHLH